MGMTGSEIAVGILLTIGVAVTLCCCLGMVAVRSAFDRLHFLSAMGTIGPATIVAAVLVEAQLSAAGLKALVVLVATIVTGPVLTHAVARAANLRRSGRTGEGKRPS
jgi:multicomponent Na+:H+ antiporter subunit G